MQSETFSFDTHQDLNNTEHHHGLQEHNARAMLTTAMGGLLRQTELTTTDIQTLRLRLVHGLVHGPVEH